MKSLKLLHSSNTKVAKTGGVAILVYSNSIFCLDLDKFNHKKGGYAL